MATMAESMEVQHEHGRNQQGQLDTGNSSRTLETRGSTPMAVVETKLINDHIHGHLELHPACMAIIDTPQFQRLRFIKQLGTVYFVYPGAAHNRFEHSIGVGYLAGRYARSLKHHQPNLDITDLDILCVEIAGLCHDLGHGPFSHMFDGRFAPAAAKRTHEPTYKHEAVSLSMFNHLIETSHLMDEGGVLKRSGLTTIDLTFIKEMIYGPIEPGTARWRYNGRGEDKGFLYEIVSNKRNGIDVDKWDYFARDCYHLGLANNFDYNRYMKFARAIKGEDRQWQICTREKEIWNLYNMYLARYSLHKHAYQHRVHCGIEAMLTDALLAADDHVLINGAGGRKYKISECHKDMVAFSLLTDNIMFTILDSDSQEQDMLTAKDIIRRIFSRKLYKTIYESDPLDHKLLTGLNEDAVMKDILSPQCLTDEEKDELEKIKDDFFVQFVTLDFGMKNANPLERLGVYSKENPDKCYNIKQEKASRFLAHVDFKEIVVRVFCKNVDNLKDRSVIIKACSEWFEKWGQSGAVSH